MIRFSPVDKYNYFKKQIEIIYDNVAGNGLNYADPDDKAKKFNNFKEMGFIFTSVAPFIK